MPITNVWKANNIHTSGLPRIWDEVTVSATDFISGGTDDTDYTVGLYLMADAPTTITYNDASDPTTDKTIYLPEGLPLSGSWVRVKSQTGGATIYVGYAP